MEIEKNTTVSLSDLFRRMKRKTLILPPHQRTNVWPQKKKEAWFASILKASEVGGTLSGLITIYRLETEKKTAIRYLNDGAQRIYFGLAEFRETCRSTKDFEAILEKVYITEQSAIYGDQKEAIDQFIQLNKGTICTPYELVRGIFVSAFSSSSYDTIWEPVFDKIHAIVSDVIISVGCSNDTTPKKGLSRETTHKRMRHDFVLLYMFLTKNTSKIRYSCANAQIKDWNEQTKVERTLADIFFKKGVTKIEKELLRFKRFLNGASALYTQIWNERRSALESPSNAHFRWWLQAYVLMHNASIKISSIRKFTEKLITETSGKTSIYFTEENSDMKHCSLGVGDVSRFNKVVFILDVTLEVKSKRKNIPRKLKPGYVNSHINAHSAHGEGETLAENSVENAFRSARDMSAEDEKKLRVLNTPKG